MKRRLARWWGAFAEAVVRFAGEVGFRAALAFEVLIGRAPHRVERRWWNRAIETPALVEVYDWTDERLLFSVLVWPSLESPAHAAPYAHHKRVEQVAQAICRGAVEEAWSLRYEVDHGLRWIPDRQVWTAQDGFAYEPPVLRTKEESKS